MKKFLALVLALVMTMSLVTISAGAKDFSDADAINYDEAVEVLTAIGVVDGYTDGNHHNNGTGTYYYPQNSENSSAFAAFQITKRQSK